jgi:hypothetical protein
MKAEGEMGYEPSLLVLMEREMDMETNKVSRTASIIKDRSTAIDGKKFHNPTFESFMPHIKYLNLGAKQLGVDVTRTSEASIPSDIRDNSRCIGISYWMKSSRLLTRLLPEHGRRRQEVEAGTAQAHFRRHGPRWKS